MKKSLFIILSVILIGGLIFTSCSTSTTPTTAPAPTTAPKTTQTTGPQYGGVLKIIVPPGVQNLGNPGQAAQSRDPQLLRPAVEFLVNSDPKGTGDYIPELATSWQYSPDYKSLTFTLRKGVKFQDGTDFNAEAAKYNLDLYRNGPQVQLKTVSSVDIIDDYTVRLNLSSYDSGLFSGLVYATWMVSPTSLKTMGDAALLHPVGTGPFKFVSYQTDVSLKYVRWDGYWQKGKPYLDGIEFEFIKDPMTQLASFKTGEAQIIRDVTANDGKDLQAAGKYNMIKYPAQLFAMAGDSAHPDSPFSNIKVRQAISYALDNAAIAKAVGFGLYDATNQFASPDSPFYNPAVVGYPYNPDKAKQLLANAGYPNGFETTITYDATSIDQQNMFQVVQGYLNAVGIKAKLDAADPARFNQLTAGGWHNQLVWFWTANSKAHVYTNPIGAMKSFLTLKAMYYNTNSLWIPVDYDTLFWETAAEPDPVKYKANIMELRKMQTDTYCLAIPIMVPYSFLFKTLNVQDCDMQLAGHTQWHPENIWLSK